MSYYQRVAGRNTDGSPSYANAADKASEAQVVDRVAAFVGGRALPMPAMCPVDWIIARHNRIVAVADLKTRPIRHDPVWLNKRKYWALMFTAAGLSSVPKSRAMALFVVRFPGDELLAIDMAPLPIPEFHLRGTNGRVKSDDDVELMADIDLATMTPVP